MDLAFQDLKLHKGRFIATIIGVGLLFTIVLAMNGLYRGNIADGTALIRSTNPDLWVVERYRGGPFNEQSILPEFYHYSIKSVPGVEKASPFIYYTVERLVNGQSRHFSIVGYDVFGGLGGPKHIVAGRRIEQAHYEMVAHVKLGAHVGDRIPLGLHTYTVVGLTNDAVDGDGDPIVYMSLHDAQEVLYQPDNEEVRNERERLLQTLSGQSYLSPDQAQRLLTPLQSDTHIINAILVQMKPGANRAEAARMIEKWLYLNAYSTKDEVQLLLKGRLASISKQLLLFRVLLLLISVVIIALVVYTFTMEKIRSIAVMKLIGAPDWEIIRMVLEQSLLLTVSAFLLGQFVIHNTYSKFPRTVLLLPGDDLVTFIVALAGGVLASILGLWNALKTEPAMALGGD
ncbi:MAG: ABC transporter permease [Nitrospiraceae bacterium]|nr:ABC transporter permease [Nitrospiraceae bacterium]